MASDNDSELDTEQLLEQGDELLRSSRRLLDDLDEVVDSPAGAAEDGPVDQTGSSADSR